MNGKNRVALISALLGTIALIGCGRGSDNQAAAPKGQVVAHIGNEVVTTQELENEFRLANIPADRQKDPAIEKRLLGDLVTRKYLVRQALDAKVDREPNVLLEILRSRELVLANAEVSRSLAKKVAGITDADVDKYIAGNPSKFANRQVMQVEQITIPLTLNSQGVVDATRDMSSLDQIDQKLTEMNVPHVRSSGSLNSSELPDNLSNQMEQKKPGDVFFFRAGANGLFVVVKSEQNQPLSGEAARNFARQALRATMLKSEIELASVSANMEAKYEGDYAQIMGPPSAPAAGQK